MGPNGRWASRSQNQLARLLKPFGITPGQIWIAGRQSRGYYRWQFEDAWERYPSAQ